MVMDGITILAFFVIIVVVIGGIVFALVTAALTRNVGGIRIVYVISALVLPAAFVVYLLVAGYLRNEFHWQHSEAYDFDGSCTLPLGNGFELSYFDETPYMAYMTRAGVQSPRLAPSDHIQRVAIADNKIYARSSDSNSADGPPDGFFSIDLATGEITKFDDEAHLRASFPKFGQLNTPDVAFWAAEDRQRSGSFWPCVAGTPFVLAAGMLLALFVRKSKKPAGIPAGS